MTSQSQFLADSRVDAFITWLAATAPNLKVHLRIPHSPKVPGGVNARVIGLDAVTDRYCWNGKWTVAMSTRTSKNWASTLVSLDALGKLLRDGINGANRVAALDVCRAILRWGGDRNPSVGAWPFLCAPPGGNLATYLAKTRTALSLATADLTQLRDVEQMNSMLTKVHALAADDGLPIYDSRVAVAIAALVEIYRRSTTSAEVELETLPALLTFPAVDPKRDVVACFQGAFNHGCVSARTTAASVAWTQAKVRLGWILGETLNRNPTLLTEVLPANGTTANRMHAFEAALFMIGYDVRCLAANFPDTPHSIVVPSKPPAASKTERKTRAANILSEKIQWKTAYTLSCGNPFEYGLVGSDGDAWVRLTKTQNLLISGAFMRDVVIEFADEGWVAGGFSMGADRRGGAPDGSFGAYIEGASPASLHMILNRQHAARIAAVMKALRYCKYQIVKKAVQLNFDNADQ